MMKPSSPLLFLTHAAALLGGCLLYSHLPSDIRPTGRSAALPTRTAIARTPQQILKDATQAASAMGTEAARREKNLAATREAIRTLKVPSDIRAALEAEAAGWIAASAADETLFSPRFAALLYHWMQTDPDACEKWRALTNDRRIAADIHLEPAALELLKQPGGMEIFTDRIPGRYDYSLATWLGHMPDVDLIRRLQSRLRPEQWPQLCETMGFNWPEDRRQELIGFALAQNQPRMLTQANMAATDAHWLIDLSGDSSIPAGFRETLTRSLRFSSSMSGDASIPLEQRLGYMGETSDYTYRNIAKNTIQQIDANGISPDWSGLIQAGQASAQDALDAISAADPELAAAAPDALREKLFYKLLAEDTPQAADLLTALPQDRRTAILLDVDQSDSPETTARQLDSVAQLMSSLPFDNPTVWFLGRQALEKQLGMSFRHCSDENAAAWIEALPPSPVRQMALAYGAKRFEDDSPGLSARLGNQITDPRLSPPDSAGQ